jgi:hypothetical protein
LAGREDEGEEEQRARGAEGEKKSVPLPQKEKGERRGPAGSA